jgi:acyl-CoA reductase-like NAD-dependent aldehyde dehydrogenase
MPSGAGGDPGAGGRLPTNRSSYRGSVLDARSSAPVARWRTRTDRVLNPATGEVLAYTADSTPEDIDCAIKSTRTAFESRTWGGTGVRTRARLVDRLADAFEDNLETLNNDRQVNETRSQFSCPPAFFRYIAGLALARRDGVIPVPGAYLNKTLRTPIGVVATRTPFNHSLMIMCKSLAAVRASGCITVVKPSEYTPPYGLEVGGDIFRIGLAARPIQRVLGYGPGLVSFLSEHHDINKLVLIGGTDASLAASSAAAKALAARPWSRAERTRYWCLTSSTLTRQ